MGESVRKIGAGERTVADPTPGMVREEAIRAGGLWSGFVSTDAGMETGWHHHGEHESSIFVIDGAIRVQFGAGGASEVEAGAGDFVYVPKRAVHRETNPGSVAAHSVVSRAGVGPVTINVDGPDPAD